MTWNYVQRKGPARKRGKTAYVGEILGMLVSVPLRYATNVLGDLGPVKQQHSAAAQLVLQHQQRAKHVLHTLFFVSNRVRNRWVNRGKDRSEHMFWCLPPVWDVINVSIPLLFLAGVQNLTQI